MANDLIRLTGKPLHVSREQTRAFLHASVAVLGYHSWHPVTTPLVVRVKPRLDEDWWAGCWDGEAVSLKAGNSLELMLTACLHEVIHACRSFPAYTSEKCTSTLTARLKPDVAALAEVLLRGTYRRAAYLAHTKIRYRTYTGDHYDPAQFRRVGVVPRYRPARRRGPKKP